MWCKKGLPLCLLLLLDVTSTNVKDQMSQIPSSPPFYIVGRGRVGGCVGMVTARVVFCLGMFCCLEEKGEGEGEE